MIDPEDVYAGDILFVPYSGREFCMEGLLLIVTADRYIVPLTDLDDKIKPLSDFSLFHKREPIEVDDYIKRGNRQTIIIGNIEDLYDLSLEKFKEINNDDKDKA